MGILTRKGNLLDAKGIIVHGCNCQGVMGAGVAKAIREKWPAAYDAYKFHQRDGWPMDWKLGNVSTAAVEKGVLVVNALTQEFYGRGGRQYVSYDAVERAFRLVNTLASTFGVKTVNFPLIGCGLAGGDWNVIGPIIDEALDPRLEKVLWLLPD